ncbi:sulfotransferase family protein [Rhizosaccharibacter radicis]|uniref:Sulfotransferase n=1 Tax=Rhizosaccharibacter radicis TaxID=2782605 RepID=A0ABT1VXY9_9PROT|nr:sulfotransferase [Acetobacteraceae bacterium KSS12]
MSSVVHLISGLPRSGSTLLGAILNQNPAIRAGMSSPVAVMLDRIMPVMAAGEYASLFDDAQKVAVLRGVFEAYHGDARPPVLFDTNRAWCARMAVADRMFPGVRVVCCVRDPVWILDSFERAFRRHPFRLSRLHGLPNAGTVFDRAEQLMQPTGSLGAAWQAFQEAYFGEWAHRLIVVDYDELADEPDRVLAVLYAELGLPAFRHDFTAVGPANGEGVDEALNTPGLHAVRPRVAREHRRTILPPQLVSRFANACFWRDGAPGASNPGGAFVLAPGG